MFKDLSELTRDPHKDTFPYYKDEISKRLIEVENSNTKGCNHFFKMIKILLNEIHQDNSDSKYYFLSLAIVGIKIKATLVKENQDKLVNKIFINFFGKEKSEINESNELKKVNYLLAIIKSAITKFIWGIDNELINDFIKTLNTEEKDLFQVFWGFNSSSQNTRKKTVNYLPVSEQAQKNHVLNNSQETKIDCPQENKELSLAVQNAQSAIQKLEELLKNDFTVPQLN